MDSGRFDHLTRHLATRPPRRAVFRGVLAGVLGLVSIEQTEARVCSAVGTLCREHATCCSGLCGRDLTRRLRCQCQSANDCPTPTGQCQIATCTNGVCGRAVAVGQSCNDGDSCTAGETCQLDGTCDGGTLAPCSETCPTGVCPSGESCTTGECVSLPLGIYCYCHEAVIGSGCTSISCGDTLAVNDYCEDQCADFGGQKMLPTCFATEPC